MLKKLYHIEASWFVDREANTMYTGSCYSVLFAYDAAYDENGLMYNVDGDSFSQEDLFADPVSALRALKLRILGGG